jgi:hypothetical protein
MANGSQYAVNGVRIRETPRLDANGNPFTATLVTFLVGQNGPFTLMFAPGQGTPEAISSAITAFVNNVMALDQKVANLNASLP